MPKEVKITKEKFKPFSELTDEEKCIYDSGYKDGWRNGGIVVMVIMFSMLIAALINLYFNLKPTQ